jgi:hypothetical protein
VFLDALKERGPFHEVGQVEVEVVVFGEGVEVAEVELQEVRRPDAAHRRHGWLSGLQLCLGLVVLLSVHHSVRLHGGEKAEARLARFGWIWRWRRNGAAGVAERAAI